MMALSQAFLEWEKTAKHKGLEVLIIRQLNKSVGSIPDENMAQIQVLSLKQIEALGEALLDFTRLQDLQAWLAQA